MPQAFSQAFFLSLQENKYIYIMKLYYMPVVKVLDISIEKGFVASEPDMNYGDGGDAW